jgi:NADH-quinone oxidoreductase subunit D
MPQTHIINYSEYLHRSAPVQKAIAELETEEMILNIGPQHPSTHGVMRLEVVTDGEWITDVVVHLGYMHRCFEKHAEALPYNQIIPYVDRLDYLAAMNGEHTYCMAVERLLKIENEIPKRVEYIRVLVAELNRIASHLLAIGTYGLDIGAVTAFLWCFRDREHILNMLEWVSGARLLYNYIWIGGLMHDLPPRFEERALEFVEYFAPKLEELNVLLTKNKIFIARTANIGILPLETAINYGVTGPSLRGSGLKWDLRRTNPYSIYHELDFDIPAGTCEMGTLGDCWDRFKVRADEMKESLKIVAQCAERLLKEHKRTPDFDVRGACPKKIRAEIDEIYFGAECPRGEMGFYIVADAKKDTPLRCKCRGGSFSNLSVLPALSKGILLADLIAVIGSLDIVLCEIDR